MIKKLIVYILEIHKIFNESHNLEEKEAPLKEICEAYSEYTE